MDYRCVLLLYHNNIRMRRIVSDGEYVHDAEMCDVGGRNFFPFPFLSHLAMPFTYGEAKTILNNGF